MFCLNLLQLQIWIHPVEKLLNRMWKVMHFAWDLLMMQAKYLENLDSLLQWGEYIFFLYPNCNCFTAGRLRLTVNSMEFSAICPPLFFQYLEVPFRVSRKTILPDFDEMFDLLLQIQNKVSKLCKHAWKRTYCRTGGFDDHRYRVLWQLGPHWKRKGYAPRNWLGNHIGTHWKELCD